MLIENNQVHLFLVDTALFKQQYIKKDPKNQLEHGMMDFYF